MVSKFQCYLSKDKKVLFAKRPPQVYKIKREKNTMNKTLETQGAF